MAVEAREMHSFTLTRSPHNVGVGSAATQVATTDVGSDAVAKKNISYNKAADRQLNSKENSRCGGVTARVTAQVSRNEPATPRATVTIGKSETKPNENKRGKVNNQVVVKSGWLMRRYSVLAKGLNGQEERSEKTISEKCTNCCFQAYIACKCKRASPQINTQELSKARTLGIKSALFSVSSDLFTETPIGSIVREFVVYGGSFFMFDALCVSAIVGFILRTVDRSNDCSHGDNYFLAGEVAISSFGMIFTTIDLIQHMCTHRCTSYTERTRGPEWRRSETPDRFELSEHNNEHNGCCKNCNKYDRAGIVRFFVTPLIVYPLLLLSIFQLLSEIIIRQVNITTIITFVLIAIVQIWFVYLVRIFIFLGMVHSIQKKSEKEVPMERLYWRTHISNYIL